jgi:hypothetical protein
MAFIIEQKLTLTPKGPKSLAEGTWKFRQVPMMLVFIKKIETFLGGGGMY